MRLFDKKLVANIVDQVPNSRVWCSCYGSGEYCKKHTERY